MHRQTQQRLARIRLVARTQVAYEQLRDANRRGRRSATAARRLSALNRALALLALQSVTEPALA